MDRVPCFRALEPSHEVHVVARCTLPPDGYCGARGIYTGSHYRIRNHRSRRLVFHSSFPSRQPGDSFAVCAPAPPHSFCCRRLHPPSTIFVRMRMRVLLTLPFVLAVGVWGLYTSFHSLRTDSIKYRTDTFERSSRPFWYWFYTAAAGLAGGGLIIVAVYLSFVRL